MYDVKVIVLGNPDESGLVKALRGRAPFDSTTFSRMPLGRPPVSEPDIVFIEQWIRDGCPGDELRFA